HGVLVTRPEQQSADLCRAIETAGGTAIRLPLLEIESRDADDISTDEKRLPRPDLTIYVSPNAVCHGIEWQVANTAVAGIGPSTAAELRAYGSADVIFPADGFDSESLLAHNTLKAVSGKNIRIVRGQQGRELLGSTLAARGARVDYLEVYTRRARHLSEADRQQLENSLRAGQISCITVMSVATLNSLFAALPGTGRELLRCARLVTPSSRVLKNITELMPGLPATLAPGPQADDMILGLIACLTQDKTE
ncbi:MAG: uroporphyrinogen-III synthase, partial [Gammaproteobacteria bacterium]|nr:uroporphyrinogen-III synthase [Gammaproteobacteria bacterium]